MPKKFQLVSFFQYVTKLTDEMIMLAKFAVQILPLMQTIMMYLLIIIGSTTVTLSLAGTLWVVNQQQQQAEREKERRDSDDFKIPLDNGQYTTIRIFPSAIKKITSRTSLFNY